MGSGGGSEPTLQQKQLETQQALTTANLNIQENAQRKALLNSMGGSRVFRGSALSRAVAGNTSGGAPSPGPSLTQQNASGSTPVQPLSQSLLDSARGSGSTSAGGAGASGGVSQATITAARVAANPTHAYGAY